MNFVEKVLAALNGGDEGKVKRFFKRFKTGLDDQVTTRRRELEEKKELIEDLNETFEVDMYTVDVEALKDTDSIKDSANEHVENLLSNRRSVREIEEEIEDIQAEIDHLESIIKQLESE